MRKRFFLFAFLLLLLGAPRAASAQFLGPPQSITVVDSGTACVTAPTACATFQVNNAVAIGFDISGTFTGTLTFEATANGNNWRTLWVTNTATGAAVSSTTAAGGWSAGNGGFIAVRLRATAAITGAAVVTATQGYGISARLFDLSNVTGVLGATNGGTGQSTVTTGDLLYGSAANTWSKLAAGATAGMFLRNGGAGTAPVWSTLVLPNAATTGDLLYATAANTIGNRAAVAVGQVLASAGTSTAPAWSGTPLLTAGTGTQTYHAGGVLYSESISTATAADNNFVKTSTYAIPANTLVNNGDMLEVDTIYLESSEATDSRTYVCNYGFTSWTGNTVGFTGGINLLSNATASASVNIHVRAFIKRVSSTVFNYWTESLVGTSYQNSVWTTSSALTITDAQNIACEVRNTDGTPVAAASTIKEFQVRYVPYF